jgi:hypothetical protein
MAPATATQSPPDLAALYQQLHSQDVRGAQMDRGLALMASAFGTQQQQHDMMNYAMSTPQDDRTKVLGQSIEAQGALTEQQNAARFRAGAAGMGSVLGVNDATAAWLANNPQAMQDALTTHFANRTETEAQKDVDAYGAAYQQANPNATPEEVAKAKTDILNYKINPVAADVAKTKANDLIEAQSKAPGAITTMQDMDQRASGIQNAIDPATGQPVMQGILNSSRKQWAAKKLIEAKDDAGWLSSAEGTLAQSLLSPAEQAAVSNLRQLNNQVYSEAFQSTGSKRTQQEVANLRAGISPLLNFNQSYNDYMKQYGDFQKTLHTGIANTYGAAQDLDNPALTPYRNLVSPEYLPAGLDAKGNAVRTPGPLYNGQGGAWASAPGFTPGAPTTQTVQGGGGGGKHYTFNPSTGKLE